MPKSATHIHSGLHSFRALSAPPPPPSLCLRVFRMDFQVSSRGSSQRCLTVKMRKGTNNIGAYPAEAEGRL